MSKPAFDKLASIRSVNFWLRLVSAESYRHLNSAPNLLLIAACCVFALAPLTAPGYFIFGHDARHSVYFLQMFDSSIRDGAWYPRWATDMVFGYGYPLWLILAPIPFYVGEAFHLAGMDLVSAVKLVDGLAFLCSSFGMYLFVKDVFGRNAAIVAAVAYAYVPYHLVDLYVRSAQAELVGFVFPPFAMWAFFRLSLTHHLRYVALAGLAYAGLLLSHIQTAVLFTPVIGLYLIFLTLNTRPTANQLRQTAEHPGEGDSRTYPRRSANIGHGLPVTRQSIRFAFFGGAALALALGIAAAFVLPVLAEQRYLTTEPLIGGFFDFRKHFLNASQLLSPFWGYGYAGENGNDQFSLQLGLVPVLLSFLSLYGLRRAPAKARQHTLFFALILIVTVFAVLSISSPLWELFSGVVAYVQFPWRLLSITTFALAVLSGASVYAFSDQKDSRFAALGLSALFLVAAYPYTEPQHTDAVFNYRTQMEFEVRDRELLGDTIWMTGERPKSSPLVPQYESGADLQKAIALESGASVSMLRHGGQSDDVQVESGVPARIVFYTRFFPGWTARIDGQPATVEPYGEQGLIVVNVPAGSHIVQLRFEDTPIRQVGGAVSAASAVIAVALLWKSRQGFKFPEVS